MKQIAWAVIMILFIGAVILGMGIERHGLSALEAALVIVAAIAVAITTPLVRVLTWRRMQRPTISADVVEGDYDIL